MVKPAPDVMPQQHGIKKYFFIQKITFGGMGIDPTSLEVTIFNKFLMLLPLTAGMTLCFPVMMFVIENKRDMEIVTDALPAFWQCLLSSLKVLCFLWNRKKTVLLIRKIFLWNLEAHDEELKILREENRKEGFFAYAFYICVVICGFMALISPIVVAYFYSLNGNGFMEYLEPPFKGNYKIIVDPKTYFGYSVAYVWNIMVVYFIMHAAISNDCLFTWLSYNISSKFRILNLRFKNVGLTTRRPGDEELYNQEIIKCIRYHQQVIDLAENFNDVYMLTVFIKFTISFLQIAGLAFLISRGGEFSTIFYYITFFCSVSIQLLLYCHGGQKIIDESSSVADAIYDGIRWHDLSIKSKKLLLLPLMRSQKPCTITGIFFVADISLYLWAFKTSGSFVTMLKAME